MGKYDDIAGGSWSMPYFHGVGGEDTKHKLNATNCGVNSSIEDDNLYTDGMIAEHAIKTMRNFSKASNSAPFFIAVGFHRPTSHGLFLVVILTCIPRNLIFH